VRQFSPAVIVDRCNCSAAVSGPPRCVAWRCGPPTCMRGRGPPSAPLALPRRACVGTRISPVTFDVCTWRGHWSRTDDL